MIMTETSRDENKIFTNLVNRTCPMKYNVYLDDLIQYSVFLFGQRHTHSKLSQTPTAPSFLLSSPFFPHSWPRDPHPQPAARRSALRRPSLLLATPGPSTACALLFLPMVALLPITYAHSGSPQP